MSSQKKHINIFDELIRVLNLKKHTHEEIVDDIIPSFDNIYSPSNKKSQKVINELIAHQNKMNRRKINHKIFYSLLIACVLLLSFLLFVRNSQNIEDQNQEAPISQEQNWCSNKDSILSKSDSITNTNNHCNIMETSISCRTNQIEIDTIKIIVTDTAHKKVYLTDTLVKKVVITDTIQINHYDSEINSGNYCLLPKVYKILFDEKSVYVDEKYNNDICELANNILRCQNLQNVEITGYYTQRFLFFNTKKLVQERIKSIKKEINKHNVSSRTLRKLKKNLIKTTKSNNLESSQLVKIILKD